MSEDPEKERELEGGESEGLHRRAFFRHFLGQEEEASAPPAMEESLLPPLAAEEEEKAEEKPVDRRNFFQETFRAMVRPAVEYLEYRLKPVLPEAEDRPPRYLRPPGADFEHLFVPKCERSGRCVEVCPVQAIRVMQNEDPSSNGTPYIHASTQACVVCDGLECMNACPSGALQVVPKAEISMGLARMSYERCLRTKGEDCRICVDLCPIGKDALIIHEERVQVMITGCVGCGVCEQQCPTWPKAIEVDPA